MRTKRTIPAHRREPRMALRPKRPPSPASGDDVTGHDVLHPSEFIAPCLPTISRVVPVGPQWAYEIKHDGFRFLAVREAKHGKCGSKDVDVRPNWREQPGMPDNWKGRPAWEE